MRTVDGDAEVDRACVFELQMVSGAMTLCDLLIEEHEARLALIAAAEVAKSKADSSKTSIEAVMGADRRVTRAENRHNVAVLSVRSWVMIAFGMWTLGLLTAGVLLTAPEAIRAFGLVGVLLHGVLMIVVVGINLLTAHRIWRSQRSTRGTQQQARPKTLPHI